MTRAIAGRVPTTYQSATIEDKRTNKRYVFVTVHVHDDHVDVVDKRTGTTLTVVDGVQPGPKPSHTRDWWPLGEHVRVREHCSPCTRNRAARTEDM